MCLPNLICAWTRVPKCPQFQKFCIVLSSYRYLTKSTSGLSNFAFTDSMRSWPLSRRVRCQGFLKDRLFVRFSTKDSLKIDYLLDFLALNTKDRFFLDLFTQKSKRFFKDVYIWSLPHYYLVFTLSLYTK